MIPVRTRIPAVTILALSLSAAAAAQQTPVPTPPDVRMEWWRAHEAMESGSLLKAARWQFVGPTNISGRATDAAVVQPKGLNYTMYVAQATGGVWKSDNEGVTWEPIFDQGPTTSIGDVTVAPSNQDVVWIGTGEANIFRSSNTGAGVWKSTDAGETFEHMGLVSSGTIPRILIHPTNPDIVYVAASGMEWSDNPDRGVYKTTNGGRTWQKVLYVNERTGAIDLVMDPRDPNTLYVATWQRIRLKWHDPRNEPDYQHSGIWKSTDGGSTWREMNRGLPEARNRGRIGIDIARSNPDVLYAFVDNYEVARPPEPGQTDAYGRPAGPVIRGASVFRTDNGGQSWRKVSADDRYMETASGTYGWVFGQLRVDPNDEDRVYMMGLQLNVSDDGGQSWRRLTGMHGDHHGLWIDPANSDYLLNNNDGGTYVSYDAGENWRFFVEIPAVQFFNVQYDMSTPFRVYGSIQDHGSRSGVVDLSAGRDNIPAVDFINAPGGEGSNHAIDPRDPSIVYSAGFYGRISRTNIETDESEDITPPAPEGQLAYRGQWLAPFIISPHNPNVLYHGFNVLHRSMDRGDTWERISGDLTYNDTTKYGDIPYQTIFSISESPLKFGLLYAGTDDGRVHMTRDGGASWTEIATRLPRGKFIAELVASKYNEATVYMAQNGKRDEDHTPYLWKSTDYGQTWTSIVGNIPIGPINVVKEDPKNPSVLYVGTDIGVYASVDGGSTWQSLPNGLPSTYVHDLVIHPRDDIMVIGTHGRGIYAMDVRPIQQLTPAVTQQPVAVLQGEPAMLGSGGRGFFGGTQPAHIWYWLGSAGPATITIRNPAGDVIRELSGDGDAGLNSVMWDLRSDTGAAAAAGGGRGGRGGFGGGAATGAYRVEVRQGSNSAMGWVQVSR